MYVFYSKNSSLLVEKGRISALSTNIFLFTIRRKSLILCLTTHSQEKPKMMHFYNDFIIEKKTLELENLTVTYRLLENGAEEDTRYSLLISMTEKSTETDLYIPDISICKSNALEIFKTMHESLVLPSEAPFLFSDGAFENIFR